MTYPFEIKDRYVELRASGLPLYKAAKKIGIARGTAMTWEKDLKERIDAYKAIHIEELQEKYRVSKEQRLKLFGERFLAMADELKKRDLSEIPTPKLFEMTLRSLKVLEEEIGEPEFLSEAEIKRKRDERILANNRIIPISDGKTQKKR
jgi:hypothetical protein